MVYLHEHNQIAYGKVKAAIEDGKRKIAISHATGTGKSYLIAKLCEDYYDDKKLILVPSRYIREQMQKLLDENNIENVDIILYQKLIKMTDEDITSMDYDVIALDEYHHDAATKVWGQKVKVLIDSHPDAIIFGTSATPVKSNGVNAVDELFDGNCVSDLPLSESIAKKIVPLPVYVGAMYTLDNELEKLRAKMKNATNSDEEKKEFYQKINTMRSQIEKSYGMPIILNRHIKDAEGKYIVFTKNKKHLEEIKDTVIGWFKTAGFKNVNAYVVHSSYEKKDAEYKAFCEDASHSLKLLFCVNMLNEGLHLKNISGVLLLRPTNSSIIWHQQIGRAIEANNVNTPVIIDAVNNFSSIGQGMDLLQEVKNAIAKEKEDNPNFDDSDFVDIDTFFVLEQVMEIQGMFREIEGRLQDSWDLYIKALKQYKEREGDCLVPYNHIEVVDDMSVKLGRLCSNVRNIKKGNARGILTKGMEGQLNQIGFVWDALKYRFENKAKDIAEYYKRNGKYPLSGSKDFTIRRLGQFLNDEKEKMCEKNYPVWKKKIIERYLPEFSCERYSDKTFRRFIHFVKIYKEKYGHTDIKCSDVIDDYKIGVVYSGLKQRRNILSEKKLRELERLGINLEDKRHTIFNKKIDLAKEAVEKGVVISCKNRIYKQIDFYNWIFHTVKKRYYKHELSDEEITTLEKLTGKQLCRFFNNGKFIKIVDIIKNKEVGVYMSSATAANIIQEKFGMNICDASISLQLSGKVTTPYKGRFMFEYATDEEVKKYLEESKVG